ncbi:putative RING finger protein P32A8.03c [Zea mays]|uniref:Putative RING finger protein P32A8.03c n=1 Tax=Zea mays TaxID=4577 RepID=A0A317YGE2_MAIZE|nr:putative RING finger protein P32A8.03c [Zea mays]
MPIASKLVYFQRRPAPAPPDDPGPEPPDPRRPRRRRRSGSLSSSHQKPEHDVPGHQRDHAAAAKPPGPVGKAAGLLHTASSAGLFHHRSTSESDHGRLPDAVQQARERLLQRLGSVDLVLAGRRHKTWPPQTLWAGAGGLARPVVDASSGGGQTSCFQFQFQPGEREPIPVFPKPAAFVAVQEVEDGRAAFADAASDCSICLERCGADGGLTQLRCGHVFHSACLQRWLRSRADCPYCRATVRARS